MFLLKNSEFKILENILKESKFDSIFISSWNSIYAMTEDIYEKLDCSFENIENYNDFMNSIINKHSNDSNNLHIKISDNIEVYFYKWDCNNFWITLKKINLQSLSDI